MLHSLVVSHNRAVPTFLTRHPSHTRIPRTRPASSAERDSHEVVSRSKRC
jgi:hypothetical protein